MRFFENYEVAILSAEKERIRQLFFPPKLAEN
jgi:hypothetical protein